MAWPASPCHNSGQPGRTCDAELPQHGVTPPGYWIGRYPVAVARFRPFVEASGYQVGDARSLEGPEDHPVVWVT